MLDHATVWGTIDFSHRLVATRAFFHKRFRELFGSEPPHESFIAWYLSRSSSDISVRRPPDIPNLDPIVRFAEMRSCLPVHVSNVALQFEKDILSFWMDYHLDTRNDWLFVYFTDGSVNVQYPDESLSFDVPEASLHFLSRSYTGDCFARDVGVLFMKYDSLFGFGKGEGRGWHLSVPDGFYSIITSELHVSCELFASPINRRASNYFSLFSSDSVFGSFGDYFESPTSLTDFLALMGNPARLSVEANPPFQPLLMMRFAHRLTRLLSDSDEEGYDFLCVCIVPNWCKCEPIVFLRESSFLIHSILLTQGDHKFKPGWVDGEQVETDPAYWKNAQTLILVLGSMAARDRHNVSEDLERRIRESWRPQ